jgi:hypothetical protein
MRQRFGEMKIEGKREKNVGERKNGR